MNSISTNRSCSDSDLSARYEIWIVVFLLRLLCVWAPGLYFTFFHFTVTNINQQTGYHAAIQFLLNAINAK